MCEGSSFTVSDVSYTEVSYSWMENGNGNITSGANSSSPTYQAAANENPTVVLTMNISNTTYTCNASADKTLTVNQNAEAYAGLDDAVCGSTPYTLSGASADHGSIGWSSSSGHNGFSSTIAENPSYTPGTTDINNGQVVLTVTVTSTNGCANASSTMTLGVGTQPTVNLTNTSASVCANENSYQMSGVAVSTGSDIDWSTSGDGNFSDPQVANPRYDLGTMDKSSTGVTLTITASDPAGACSDATDNFTLTIQQPHVIDAGGSGSVTLGTTSYQITGASAPAGTFQWQVVGGNGSLDHNDILDPTYTIFPADAGIIEFRLTSTQGVCTVSDVHELQILHQPFDLVFVLDISGSMGGSITPGTSKLDKLRMSLQEFFTSNSSEIQANDQVAAVYFATQVNQSDGSLVNWGTGGSSLLANMLTAQCGGSICWTAMGGGLQAAFNELTSPANIGNGHTKNIILITDGEQNLNPIVRDDVNPMTIDDHPTDPYYDTYDCGIAPASPNPTELNGTNIVKIYTIGIGVPSSYGQLLEDIAIKTDGITNLQLTNPHELSDFLANNFLDILRTGSPQIIDYRYRTSGSGTIRESFTVNNDADHITLKLLGDRGDADFYKFKVWKDGTEVTGMGTTADEDFFRIYHAELPISTTEGTIDAGGEWTMEFAGSPDREYQAVGIASEHKFRYRCSAGDRQYVTGEALKLEAEVSHLGRNLDDARVTCTVLKPGEDINDLFANNSVALGTVGRADILNKDMKYIRKTFLRQAVNDYSSAASLKASTLMKNPDIIDLLIPDSHVVNLRYENGMYRGSFHETDLNGSYRLIFRIHWEDKTYGEFVRTESRSVVVRFGTPDMDNTEVFSIPPSLCYKNWRVAVRPVDKFGRLLGPGFAGDIDAGRQAWIVDNLEGTYTIVYKNRDLPEDTKVSIKYRGKQFYSGILGKISRVIPADARKIRRKPTKLLLPVKKVN
jgi:hypothetical protein